MHFHFGFRLPKLRFAAYYCLLALLLLAAGCGKSPQENGNAADQETSTDSTETTTEVKYAKGFRLSYDGQVKKLDILNGADTLHYLLLKKGAQQPAGLENTTIIRVPIRSLVALSSTHIALLDFLEANEVLTGLENLDYVYSPKVIEMINAGKVVSIGKSPGLNEEKLVEMQPDLVMAVGSPGAKADPYRVLHEAGIPVLINSEWIENTPLGRAEWVKVAAALLDKEELVNEKFGKIETEYGRLSALVQKAKVKPKVISGLNTKDAWFVPSGDSYMSRFLADAGANYPWASQKNSGSIPLSFEAVYPNALTADFWVNVGFDKNDTKASVVSQDSRYADFKAFKSGQVYSYNNRVNARNANDFFESGIVNPHLILADLIHIFHPDLLPEHKLVYYKQLK